MMRSRRYWGRPGRIKIAGEAWRARVKAASAPMESLLAPVMGTVWEIFFRILYILGDRVIWTDRFDH